MTIGVWSGGGDLSQAPVEGGAGAQTQPDVTAPFAVVDLSVASTNGSSATLNLTAPTDDPSGDINHYIVKYALAPIANETDFTNATLFDANFMATVQNPATQAIVVTGLADLTQYYFSVKAVDLTGNESAISNSPTGTTTDATAPDAIVGATLVNATGNTIDMQFTAPIDNSGAVDHYEVRYSDKEIVESGATIAQTNWVDATVFSASVAPTTQNPGTESIQITGLTSETTYFSAAKAVDALGNVADISNSPSGNTLDVTAPAAIADLTSSVVAAQPTKLGISWTAPGDSGNNPGSTATSYEIRYSLLEIVESGAGAGQVNFSAASLVAAPPTPSIQGTTENFEITGLTGATPYYVAIKTSDEVPNQSLISNVVLGTTEDLVAPSTLVIALNNVGANTVDVDFTAATDNSGLISHYLVKYDTIEINTELKWTNATQFNGNVAPTVVNPAAEQINVTGLPADTTLFFAVRAVDLAGNIALLSNSPSITTIDNIAPADITDLALSNIPPFTDRLRLNWTAPGDNGNDAGTTATAYEIRFSTLEIVDSGAGAGQVNFNAASLAPAPPTPSVQGTIEAYDLLGLTPLTTYYVAVKTVDEVPNQSGISNVPFADTNDFTPPASITDLAATTPAWDKANLTWTAPGDDGTIGTATSYDIRYALGPIVESGASGPQVNWASATPVGAPPVPQPAGSAESFEITGLDSETAHWFGIKASDEVPNESILSNVPTVVTLQKADPAHVASSIFNTHKYGAKTIFIERGHIAFQFFKPTKKN